MTDPAFRSLDWHGRYLVVGFASGEIARLPVNLPLLKGVILIGVDYRQAKDHDPGLNGRIADALLALFDVGALAPQVGHVHDRTDYRAAISAVAAGTSIGRTVLRVDPPA